MSNNISYTRQFSWKDYVDFVDSVQAGGTNGINVRMHSIETEFNTLSGVIGQINAELFFQPFGTAGAVAYTGGNVGIGAGFSAASPPVYELEVNLGDNTSVSNQVRFGNAVCSNGNTGAFSTYAVFAHKSHAFDSDFALRQGPNGNVDINAAAGQKVRICQSGTAVRLGISPAGNVIVGNEIELPGAPATAVLQVQGDAFKTGAATWTPSDARLKEDVRELEVGLAELRRVRPVRFRYNGRAGTRAGQPGVGVLGQEIEKIFPEMIQRVPWCGDGEPDTEDLRIYDDSALTYVLVNAVKELVGRVEKLEQALGEAREERGRTVRPAKLV